MKFANKIIWSCLITLSILFSISSTFMIYQNHKQILKTTITTKLSNHDIEVNSLESRLLQDSIDTLNNFKQNKEWMQDRIVYYLNQFQIISPENKKVYALVDEKNDLVYSSLPIDAEKELLETENQTYILKHIHDQYYLTMKSPLQAGRYRFYILTCYDITPLFQERNKQLKDFIIISIILYIITFFILKFISRYLTEPIHKLNEVSKRIARGQYEERTNIESNDEIGELSKSFDEMASINEKTIHQLQDSVTQKEEFMASFSHEIKTPMTAILGFADSLRSGVCDEETQKKAAQYIYTEGKRLEHLSYTLMDLLKLNHQKITLQSVYIPKIIRQLQNYYSGLPSHANLKFYYDDIYVKSQSDLLFVLLRNLIDNAIKASKDNQDIIIKIIQTQKNVEISVKDERIGMDNDSILKATEPFYMADKSRSRSQGGAGLGLTIVKRICDLHQTNLLFDSKVHRGTTVSFFLEADKHA